MKRTSARQRRALPALSVPAPVTWATPTKPLKSVIVPGTPPRPGTAESAGPGVLRWTSGPPNRLGTRTPPGIGRGATLGRQRSSNRSRDSRGRAAPGRRGRARRRAAGLKKLGQESDHIAVLLEKAVCVTVERLPPGAQTGRRGGVGPVRGLLGGKDPTGRFLNFMREECPCGSFFLDFSLNQRLRLGQ